MTRHKHADVIHAWADGAEIQIQASCGGEWWDDPIPLFLQENNYRIKPRTVKREGWVNIYRVHNPEMPEMLCCIHPTQEGSKTFAGDGLVATVKVEWEEEE